MGSIDIIKPLSTVLSSAVNKSREHQEKNSWERWESNPGLMGEKQVWYLCASSAQGIYLNSGSGAIAQVVKHWAVVPSVDVLYNWTKIAIGPKRDFFHVANFLLIF